MQLTTNMCREDVQWENICRLSNYTSFNQFFDDLDFKVALDWIEQCFTSPPTQFRLYGRRFLQVKNPTNSIKVLKEKFAIVSQSNMSKRCKIEPLLPLNIDRKLYMIH